MLLDYVYLVWSSSLLAQDLADLLQGKTKILISVCCQMLKIIEASNNK